MFSHTSESEYCLIALIYFELNTFDAICPTQLKAPRVSLIPSLALVMHIY